MNLTEEDWKSDEADAAAIAAAIAFAFAAGILATRVTLDVNTTLAIGALVAVCGAIVIVTNIKSIRFPGAYLHYKRRIKS